MPRDSWLVFYPAGCVDARSYAPAARGIAREGHLAVIVPMPFNLTAIAPERAQSVIGAFPNVEYWAIAGHSLGGTMAARLAGRHPSMVEGLALWAAYPAASSTLAESHLVVVSIYGTRDGLAAIDKTNASRQLLPPGGHWVVIKGGNHAQFGWYDPQAGDNRATISREAQ